VRAKKAAAVRNSPDGYITTLERTDLTTAQKRRLAVLLMPFLDGAEPRGAGAEDAA
jgi:hypothetical protein